MQCLGLRHDMHVSGLLSILSKGCHWPDEMLPILCLLCLNQYHRAQQHFDFYLLEQHIPPVQPSTSHNFQLACPILLLCIVEFLIFRFQRMLQYLNCLLIPVINWSRRLVPYSTKETLPHDLLEWAWLLSVFRAVGPGNTRRLDPPGWCQANSIGFPEEPEKVNGHPHACPRAAASCRRRRPPPPKGITTHTG